MGGPLGSQRNCRNAGKRAWARRKWNLTQMECGKQAVHRDQLRLKRAFVDRSLITLIRSSDAKQKMALFWGVTAKVRYGDNVKIASAHWTGLSYQLNPITIEDKMLSLHRTRTEQLE